MTVHAAKVTSKGQITLPVELRKLLGIKPGDRVDFRKNRSGVFELTARRQAEKQGKSLVRYHGPELSSEDIVELVRRSREGTGDAYLAELRRARGK